jgi:hypothetical protein
VKYFVLTVEFILQIDNSPSGEGNNGDENQEA